jgi:ATP-dependent exoDNAse (exonuclease V) alpha subunit
MKLTKHQEAAFQKIQRFIASPTQQIFVLKGYAGTGKTTLVKFLLDFMAAQTEVEPILLASTGRAAKVLETKAKYEAFTVHSHIYSFEVLGGQQGNPDKDWTAQESGQLTLSFALKSGPPQEEKRLYIVDEASMLSDVANQQNTLTKFGSGNLLLDLLKFAGNNKIIFVGDPVQLPPPVGNNPFSPALDINFLTKRFKKEVVGFELLEILRQKEGHAILDLATRIRQLVTQKEYPDWEEVMAVKGALIYSLFTQNILIDRYLSVVGNHWDKAIILTHSNKQAFFLNINVRKKRYQGENPNHLMVGELLMIVQNSYHVPLANGDQVIVRRVRAAGRQAGFSFLRVEVEAIHNRAIYSTLLLGEFLFKPEANLDPEKQRGLLIDFDKRARKKGLRRNSKEYKDAMRNDEYLNALRAKFGYAVTCHKAQGGEWPNVFLNLSETLNMLDAETRFRWLYTAVTRAQEVLNLKPVWKQKGGFNRNQRR